MSTSEMLFSSQSAFSSSSCVISSLLSFVSFYNHWSRPLCPDNKWQSRDSTRGNLFSEILLWLRFLSDDISCFVYSKRFTKDEIDLITQVVLSIWVLYGNCSSQSCWFTRNNVTILMWSMCAKFLLCLNWKKNGCLNILIGPPNL